MDYASSLLGLLPGGRRTPGLKELLAAVGKYLTPEQVKRVEEAAEFGASAHKGQKRLSGEPFIAHPVAAAAILADLHLDADTLIAAILHDVIEDTPTPKDQLAARFGADVAELVDGVTKLDAIQFKSREEAQAESFRKMLLAMVRDLRVILVKLADRTHNMRTIQAMPLPRRRAVARETLEIYAPIAERLGLYNMKLELEDLGFEALYPHRYQVLERALRKARGNQKEFMKKIDHQLTGALAKSEIQARVETREKHLYSIYKKMLRKRASLAEIVDVYGLRIITDKPDTCYRALGIVHAVFRPMPGRFKDYIAIPRVNGYQSLHTTLFGPNGVPIEAQIRTEDMHRVAESGIAAHWKYKSGGDADSMQQQRTREWLSGLVELQEDGTSEEFLESVKVDLFPDKVYVFTPKGTILRLPSGATVVDFAYAVHTDIGNRCVAAKVDRRLTPLRTVLRNGQTVEIITAKGAMPNPSWVNFVVTAKARNAIRHYLKSLRRTEAIALGQRLLNQALGEFRSDTGGSQPRGAAGRARGVRHEGSRRSLREDRPRRAPGAPRRAAPPAGAAGTGRRSARAGAACDRRHGRAARFLRTLLLPAAERPGVRIPLRRPRRDHPPGALRQRRGLPQASREMAAGELAVGAGPALQLGDPHLCGQPHRRAGGGRRGHRQHGHQHPSRLDRGAGRQRLDPDFRAESARSQASGACDARHPAHAGRDTCQPDDRRPCAQRPGERRHRGRR